MELQIRIKNVYGNDLTYPANELAGKMADLLQVKTFNQRQMDKLLALGYTFKQVI